MAHLQEIFDRIKEAQKEKREISEAYRDVLNNSEAYQNTLDDLKKLKEKKINIEKRIQEECRSEFTKMENLQKEINDHQQRMSDLAITKLMQKEKIEITDGYDNKYEPVFKVSFKKIN
jgi:chromosome segregation ATPase